MTDQTTDQPAVDDHDVDPPPLLGSWPRLYGAVLAHLAFWIALLFVFTSYFDPT